MKFTVLIENTSKGELICEHGLSLLIEFGNERILLDAGSSGAFLDNAYKMGIDIDNINKCVLSHGHYDHSNGFGAFIERNENAKIYAMADVTREYYSNSGGSIHYIGLSEELLNKKENFIFVNNMLQISENVYIVPHSTRNLHKIGERVGLYRKEGDEFLPDDFKHELSLVFDTEKGLIVFNSCSHAGAINILEEVMSAFKGKRVYAFIGGLHLKGKKNGVEICAYSKEEVREIANKIVELGVERLFTGHCTGVVGAEWLKGFLGDKLGILSTGICEIL